MKLRKNSVQVGNKIKRRKIARDQVDSSLPIIFEKLGIATAVQLHPAGADPVLTMDTEVSAHFRILIISMNGVSALGVETRINTGTTAEIENRASGRQQCERCFLECAPHTQV